MRKDLFLLFVPLFLITSCGSTGRTYSEILSPQNLRKHVSEDLITYSKELGLVKEVSRNGLPGKHFEVLSTCRTRGSECNINDHVEKFYSFYCKERGGTDGFNLLLEKINYWNKKLDEEIEKLDYPKSLKDKQTVITAFDLLGLSDFIPFPDQAKPDLVCYIPSEKKFFLVYTSYKCYSEYGITKCPYKVEVAEFNPEQLDRALEKIFREKLEVRKKRTLKAVEGAKERKALVSTFRVGPACGLGYFDLSWTLTDVFFKFINPTDEPVSIDFNRVLLVARAPGLGDALITLAQSWTRTDLSVRGDCEVGKNMSVIVKPKGKCSVLVRGLESVSRADILNVLEKKMDIYLVLGNKAYPVKPMSVYDLTLLEDNFQCER
jgi:hypothetical protein